MTCPPRQWQAQVVEFSDWSLAINQAPEAGASIQSRRSTDSPFSRGSDCPSLTAVPAGRDHRRCAPKRLNPTPTALAGRALARMPIDYPVAVGKPASVESYCSGNPHVAADYRSYNSSDAICAPPRINQGARLRALHPIPEQGRDLTFASSVVGHASTAIALRPFPYF